LNRGEDIMEGGGGGGERTPKSGGGGGSSGKAPKETLKPKIETSAPGGNLTVSIKGQSTFLSETFNPNLILTNTR
jgi:hypothetical protein